MSSVEMALVLPLLLLLTMGLIEYGWLFLKAQQITNTARQAARLGALPYSTNSDVITSISEMMTSAGMSDSGYSVSLTPGDVTAVPPHQPVRVEITVPCANVVVIGVPLIPVPVNLRSFAVMAKEGA